MLMAVLISIGVAVGSLAVWFVALLTAYSLDHALDMVLKQALWVVPASIAFAIPILMTLPVTEKSQPE